MLVAQNVYYVSLTLFFNQEFYSTINKLHFKHCPEIHCFKKLGTASTDYFYISLKKGYYAAETNYLGFFSPNTNALLAIMPFYYHESEFTDVCMGSFFEIKKNMEKTFHPSFL